MIGWVSIIIMWQRYYISNVINKDKRKMKSIASVSFSKQDC